MKIKALIILPVNKKLELEMDAFLSSKKKEAKKVYQRKDKLNDYSKV